MTTTRSQNDQDLRTAEGRAVHDANTLTRIGEDA